MIFLDQKMRIKQSKTESLDILLNLLSMKMKKSIINDQEQVIFEAVIILNMKVMMLKMKRYLRLKTMLIKIGKI